MPVIALCMCNFARSFVFFLLLTNEPAYLNSFDTFNIAQNGIFSSFPHIFMVATALSSGPIADALIKHNILSCTQVRKIFTCLGFGMEAVCFLLLTYISDGVSAIIFLTVGVGISGFTVSGWQINHLDLAPRYASILVAITTEVGTVAGILMPILVGVMTPDQTVLQWQNVCLLTSLILGASISFYGVFGSGEQQSWAEPSRAGVQLVSTTDPFRNGKPYNAIVTQDMPAENIINPIGKDILEVQPKCDVSEGPILPVPKEHTLKHRHVRHLDTDNNPFEESDEHSNLDTNPFSEDMKNNDDDSFEPIPPQK